MLRKLLYLLKPIDEFNCKNCKHSRIVSVGPPLDSLENLEPGEYRKNRLKVFYECGLKKIPVEENMRCLRFSKR